MAEAGGWSTIESDEGVFTSLIENLGVKGVQFEELISLDADTIRSLSPVYGVIFLFKYLQDQTPTTPTAPKDGTYDTNAPENLFFAAQTIQNACGTQAILSVILNQDNAASTPYPIDIGRELRSFKDFTAGFPAELRGEALSNSETVRTAHNAFARASPFVDETVRSARDEEGDVYHFIAYTAVNGTLYELDGLQPYPISHGGCDADGFPEKVIGVLQRRIERYPEGETRFNLMAVVRDLRVGAREIGDVEVLEREARKRKAWDWENTLRRSNFVGFIGEVLKGVVGMKEKEGKLDEWVQSAKGETERRLKR
ncbi:ubiquitin carboxyl-terminal hydrolase [Aspergillus coremiiformis]|uniref:Ubiquitin carboxyl-terminal hydrolase n=1 Tax=Aspergillus coremiiformis TaxID=138285 RepID=A0A5N6ZCH1_9EURO|nr:ubiquitin carboxyl-terminal hydrolase [Aspergillus coremiiformis]